MPHSANESKRRRPPKTTICFVVPFSGRGRKEQIKTAHIQHELKHGHECNVRIVIIKQTNNRARTLARIRIGWCASECRWEKQFNYIDCVHRSQQDGHVFIDNPNEEREKGNVSWRQRNRTHVVSFLKLWFTNAILHAFAAPSQGKKHHTAPCSRWIQIWMRWRRTKHTNTHYTFNQEINVDPTFFLLGTIPLHI